MKIFKILTIFCTAFLFSNCSKSQNLAVLPVSEFETKLKNAKDAQLIDVRTPNEYLEGALTDAKNIDWNGDNFEAEVSKLDKSKPVFVYCLAGGRSNKAATKLINMGFTEVYDMQGRNVVSNNNSSNVNIGALGKGAYIVKVVQENGNIVAKQFIKE